jgi:hypothetical protein
LYYYYSKKKAWENDVTSDYDITSGHVTDVISGHMISDDVTSGSVISVTLLPVAHLSQIMMAYMSSKQSSTDQAPNMPPPPQYSQSNDEEPYYILKTNNPFLFWEPLSCNVFYVIYSLLLLSVSRKQVPHM